MMYRWMIALEDHGKKTKGTKGHKAGVRERLLHTQLCLQDEPQEKIIPDQAGPQPRVDAVEEAAVARNDVARILQVGLAFEHALAQVAQRREQAEQQTQDGGLQEG